MPVSSTPASLSVLVLVSGRFTRIHAERHIFRSCINPEIVSGRHVFHARIGVGRWRRKAERLQAFETAARTALVARRSSGRRAPPANTRAPPHRHRTVVRSRDDLRAHRRALVVELVLEIEDTTTINLGRPRAAQNIERALPLLVRPFMSMSARGSACRFRRQARSSTPQRKTRPSDAQRRHQRRPFIRPASLRARCSA